MTCTRAMAGESDLEQAPRLTMRRQESAGVRESLGQKVQRLRARLAPLANKHVYKDGLDLSEENLSQWLRASDQDVVVAEVKIRRQLAFRHKHKIDRLLTHYRPPDILSRHYPGGVCGQDRGGSPIYYELFGLLDLKGLLNCVSSQELITFKIYQFEKIIQLMKRMSREQGRTISDMLMIVDFQGSNRDTFWGPSIRAWAQMIEVLQDLYPCLVKKAVLINDTGPMYGQAFLALRPYLQPSTLRVMQFLGCHFFKYLVKLVEKHEIPAYLGGYKCDYDNNPYCRVHICWENKVPAWSHLSDPRMAAQVTHRVILAGEKQVEEYHVSLAKGHIRWRFYTISRPLLFSIYLDRPDKGHCLLPPAMLTSQSRHTQGLVLCPRPGRYFLCLDNSHNHTRSCKLTLSLEIAAPDYLTAKLALRVPIGDTIDFNEPIGPREEQLRLTAGLTRTASNSGQQAQI